MVVAIVAGPLILGNLGCKHEGCCSCGFTGGSKVVVASPALLGTLGCQKDFVVAISLQATSRSRAVVAWPGGTGNLRMQAGRLLQLRFHWR